MVALLNAMVWNCLLIILTSNYVVYVFSRVVMEVTRSNFANLLPTIKADIEESDFFAIDGEFTGLHSGKESSIYDTAPSYYKNIKEGAMQFLFFQFGLALFKFDNVTKKYTHKTFNFYLFPRPDVKSRGGVDHRFLCQASCMDFLAGHGFDFNKVFREGISFLNEPDEKRALEFLERRKNIIMNADNELIEVPEEYKRVVDDACAQVERFLNSSDRETEIVLSKVNGFIKKIVHQQVAKKFNPAGVGLISLHSMLIARKGFTPEQKQKELEDKFAAEEKEVKEVLGFTQIMRILSKSRKLMIGHNLFMDLCHILKQFFMPLPDDYKDFKSMLHSIFPKLIDTKYMCSSEPFRSLIPSSALVNIIPVLKENPFNLPEVGSIDPNYSYRNTDNKHHEAGFDAYITGLTFLGLANYLRKNKGNTSVTNDIMHHKSLDPYINRIHVMKVLDTHMNVAGEDPVVSRDHVFYITFPRKWRFKDVSNLFNGCGPISVNWLDDESAWIGIHKRDLVCNVSKINTTIYEGVSIRSYEEYQTMIQNKEDPSANSASSPAAATTPSAQPFFSPDTSSALKKRKREVQSTPSSTGQGPVKVRRSRSIGRESLSKMSFETIPEVAEETDSPLRKKRLINDFEPTPEKATNKEFDEDDTWD